MAGLGGCSFVTVGQLLALRVCVDFLNGENWELCCAYFSMNVGTVNLLYVIYCISLIVF